MGEGEYFRCYGRPQSVALCVLKAYGLQAVMLNDKTWLFFTHTYRAA